MSYQHVNREIWDKHTGNLTRSEKQWLYEIINLHRRNKHTTLPIWLSRSISIKAGVGVVYIQAKDFSVHKTTISRVVNILLQKQKLAYICHSLSSSHGGVLVYIMDYYAITEHIATEHWNPEQLGDFAPRHKIELLTGEYDQTIQWFRGMHGNTTDSKNATSRPLTDSKNATSQQKVLIAENSITDSNSSSNKNTTDSTKTPELRSNLTKGSIYMIEPDPKVIGPDPKVEKDIESQVLEKWLGSINQILPNDKLNEYDLDPNDPYVKLFNQIEEKIAKDRLEQKSNDFS